MEKNILVYSYETAIDIENLNMLTVSGLPVALGFNAFKEREAL